jgi:hypothetical protein
VKKAIVLFIIAAGAILVFFSLRHTEEKTSMPKAESIAKMTNTDVPNPPPASLPESVSNNMQSTEVVNTSSAPFLIMGKTPQQMIAEKNSRSQDFYGKAVDQYGQPVPDVEVSGTLIIETDEGFNTEPHTTKTDLDGLFEFTGLHGADLNVKAKKDGYKLGDRGEGYQGPTDGKSSPGNRAIFTMWKLRGAEPLISSSIDVKIPHDGSSVTFDIARGIQSPNGDFQVTLSQYPLEVQKGWERFDWSVKVEILKGGLVEENDAYPFLAPADGYQPSFEFNESTNTVKWLGGLQRKFYIKTAQGQYGLMQFKVFPGRSPTGLEVNFTINPSGSQNLEPDFSK